MALCGSETQKVQIGNGVRSTGTFTNAFDNFNPIDPSEVYLDVLDPNGNETTYQWAVDPEVFRQSVGVYYVNVYVNLVGTWYFRWWSQGNVIASTEKPLQVIQVRTY